MTTKILSVGIDIGTSTTQIVFSHLTLENLSSLFAIPRIEIIDKKVIYRSEIYFTPLISQTIIDADGVESIVRQEYIKAGFKPEDTSVGAVIITGESARKENADQVLERLSAFGGDFVVATAGPDLEAIMAGKGSGAWEFSKKHGKVVANLDVGGGTTNIVVFDSGQVVAQGCYDIGGRLVRIKNGAIEYISPAVKKIAVEENVSLEVGQRIDPTALALITKRMNKILEQALLLKPADNLTARLVTHNSSALIIDKPIDCICLSGGVADLIHNPPNDLFKYGDIGGLLAESIKKGQLAATDKMILGSETIRATVIGAGSYSTTISGSTVRLAKGVLPIKNIPALVLAKEEDLYANAQFKLEDKILWFQQQLGSKDFLLGFEGIKNPSYEQVQKVGKLIADSMDKHLPISSPLIVIMQEDTGKALGQVIQRNVGEKRAVLCIDQVSLEQGDYIDIGEPLMNGLVVPLVVKTVILG